MAKKISTFATLKVAAGREGSEPLVLTFIDRDVMAQTEGALRAAGVDVLDVSPGFQIFRDEESAMRAVRAFCKPVNPAV